MFKRVVIKISGEVLGGKDGGFDNHVISRITSEIQTLINKGVEVTIVVGGGNFWRGRSADSAMDLVAADQIGIIATIMNGIYLSDFFAQKGIQSTVMTPFDINSFTERFTKPKAMQSIKNGKVLIFAGGTGHPFFSTDTIVALRACEIEADAILFAKNIDGVYDSDPRKNTKAKKYKTISYDKALSDNLDVADISAINLAAKNNIISLVFALEKENSIVTACKNNNEIFEIGGTKISNDFKEEFYE
jgi:uridylate kinase